MSVLHFKAEEVLEMAEALEEKGAKFYRQAAEILPELRGLLLDLARMEDEHLEAFRLIRTSLPEGAREVLDEEALHYLRSWADSHLFRESPEEALRGIEDPKGLLKKAMALERDSIAFYLGLVDFVPSGWGREKVEEVIGEERGHLKTLAERLREVEGGDHGRI